MNLFELIFLGLAVGGAIAGAVFGWQSYGVLGAVGGVFVGTVTGLVSAAGLTLVFAVVAKVLFGETLGRPQKR